MNLVAVIRIISGPIEAAPDEAVSSYSDPCADCITHQGLCRRHEASVLPQLAQPFWYRHAHSGMYRELKEQKDHSPEALKLIRRKERRRSKRLTELKLFAITARPNAGFSFVPE